MRESASTNGQKSNFINREICVSKGMSNVAVYKSLDGWCWGPIQFIPSGHHRWQRLLKSSLPEIRSDFWFCHLWQGWIIKYYIFNTSECNSNRRRLFSTLSSTIVMSINVFGFGSRKTWLAVGVNYVLHVAKSNINIIIFVNMWKMIRMRTGDVIPFFGLFDDIWCCSYL